jgi:hypothetical protein
MINEEVLQRVKERGISYIKRTEDNCLGNFLRNNCLLKHVSDGKIEGRIEVKERRGRRREQLPYSFNPYPANVENRVSS